MPRTNIQARELRNNPTDAERRLWYALRNRQLHGFKFTRQYSIGNFIADFCCRERLLIIEVDGGGHALQQEYDCARSQYLVERGYVVLRFWNNDVLRNLNGVLEKISEVLVGSPGKNEPPTL